MTYYYGIPSPFVRIVFASLHYSDEQNLAMYLYSNLSNYFRMSEDLDI